MRSECFLDTNILVYAAAGKRDEPAKYPISYELVLTQRFGVSGQTLAEFYWNISRKPKIPLTAAEIDEWIVRLAAHPFTPVDVDIVSMGIFLSRRYRIAYWDAALLAASEKLGASIFYTEDLNHGQLYGSVRAINPFKSY